ncbi:MAG TPA: twin-arginine translocation signal domain-containing protein [Desulfurobacteriaceae bacterium]|nr:twin-arginine translocation signal domain-containing protein [Desulfurobacteriaceae bacterium]
MRLFNEKVDRRSFLRGCALAATMMGLPATMAPKIAKAVESEDRPPVVWLHFQECTGCSESILRATHPDILTLITKLISLDYHETLMVASGELAEKALEKTLEEHEGNIICIVEGSIPLKEGFCKIAGKEAKDILKEVGEKSKVIVNIGTCSAYGGIQKASPNPSNSVAVEEIIHDKPIVNVPGCPPNPDVFLATLLYIIMWKKLPPMDTKKRPLFAFGRRIHDHCERRPHFDEGRFVEWFGDLGHKQGYCLYKVGCKAPEAYSPCSIVGFNSIGVWPVKIGHGCIGCTEPDFWDTMSPFYQRLPGVKIPGKEGIIASVDKIGWYALTATGVALAAHAAAGIIKGAIKGTTNKDPHEENKK